MGVVRGKKKRWEKILCFILINSNSNDPFRVQRDGNKMVDNNSMYVINHSKVLVFGGKKKTIINIELW